MEKLEQHEHEEGLGIRICHDVNEFYHEADGIFRSSGMLMLLVLKGELTLHCGDKAFKIYQNEGAMLFPGRPFNVELRKGEDNVVQYTEISLSLLKQFYFDNEHSVSEQFHRYKDNPIIKLSDGESEIIRNLSNIIELCKKAPTGNSHYGKMCLSMLRGLFYMLLDTTMSIPDSDVYTTAPDNKEIIFKNFLVLINRDGGRLHKVADYAKKLCVSSQYLSKICIEVGGQTPSYFINARVADEIQMQLLYTNKSVKEIAFLLNFSSPSFFGRFVKEHLGTTPRQLRESHAGAALKEEN